MTKNGGKQYPDHPFSLYDANDYRDNFGFSSQNYIDGYLGQLQVHKLSYEKKIETLLSLKPQPVIIIQSDHGPGAYTHFSSQEKTNLKERFGVLNAIRLPGNEQWKVPIPETTTLVNTFPVVFNRVFDENFPLQSNLSFYTPRKGGRLSQPVDVTKIVTSQSALLDRQRAQDAHCKASPPLPD